MRKIILLLTLMTVLSVADERWLSLSELCERWSMPAQTLYDWRRRGYGPMGVRLGRGDRGFIRYRLSEIERFEHEREQAESAVAVS
jgi:predicted DNA-binding transcriptional regulator AlpA